MEISRRKDGPALGARRVGFGAPTRRHDASTQRVRIPYNALEKKEEGSVLLRATGNIVPRHGQPLNGILLV
jgi:hypothetical protein